jgi:predicted  nucleic acid-binding Zn-ribbon protein
VVEDEDGLRETIVSFLEEVGYQCEQATGLGMAIVKGIVTLMGGEILCESAVDQGTAFTVHLPLTPSLEAPLKKTIGEKDAALLKGKRVLLFEDNNINAEIEELNTLTKQRKREVDQAKIMIGNYKEQQNNVRNNREFDAITKEIEYQELEIELAEKRLKEYSAGVKAKKLQLEEAENLSVERAADLAAKKAELEGIEAETAPLVAEYAAQGERVKEKIDERLLAAYDRIRRNVRNGLAVVTVKRDACGGCFNRIPPQRQVDIRQGKKIIICEYCGRILVADPDETQE